MKPSEIQRLGRGACAAAAALLAACGGSDAPAPTGRSMSAPASASSAAANQAPQVERVTLEPREPLAGTSVTARAQATDPDGDAVSLQYVWTFDGQRVAERGSSLAVPESARKGVAIEVEVTAHDGRVGSQPAVAAGRVGNRAPHLESVKLEPAEGVKVGGELVAVPLAEDPDGDGLRFATSWRVNGRAVEGSGERFSTAGLKRGDRVQARVTASDGDSETSPVDSDPVALGNSAPTITSTPSGVSADGRFRYAVEAEDPDGDRNLRYRLATGPEGAAVDPLLGEVTWSATGKDAGTHAFEVVVSDGHGGETKQRFEVAVKEVQQDDSAEDAPVASIE
jgi:hypothetical protein